MQADPFIDGATQVGGFNRYAYLKNNPLNATDPTGHFAAFAIWTVSVLAVTSTKIGKESLRSFMRWAGPGSGPLYGFVSAVACGPLAGVCAGVLAYNEARAFGASSSDALGLGMKAFAIGTASVIANGVIGEHFSGGGEYGFWHITAHAIKGGVLSSMGGGKFAHGFWSAGFSEFLTPYIATLTDFGNDFTVNRINVFEAALAGAVAGTISERTGGSFASGFVSGVYQNIFNNQGRGKRGGGRAEAGKNAKDHRRGLMWLGEKLRGESVRALIASHDGDINNAASAYGVDTDLLRAHVYEEQTNLLPLIESDLAESLGLGSTVGLGQVTVGKFGYTRDQLLDSATNIKSMAQLMDTFKGPLSIEYKATLYNCGSCTNVTDYGMRVKSYRDSFIADKW